MTGMNVPNDDQATEPQVDPEPPSGYTCILAPVFNDWEAAGLLLQDIDKCVQGQPDRYEVLLVDDASNDPPDVGIRSMNMQAIRRVSVLPLRRNLGHQRAIAIGLAYVEQHRPCERLVIMDADGEDAPKDIPRLVAQLKANGDTKVVFAERTRRSETLVFRVFYKTYCWTHLALSGIRVRVGNFSAVPFKLLRRLVVVSELWNHYAAAVFKSRIPYELVPTKRANRLQGQSRMNFVSLVSHGLSAMSVHGDKIGVRLLIISAICIFLLAAAMVGVVAIRLFTNLAVPGWASTIGGLGLVLMTQGVSLIAVFLAITLQGRATVGFIPLRDYTFFVNEPYDLFPGTGKT